METVEYQFTVNGFDVGARYTRSFIDGVVLPLLRDLTNRQINGNGKLLVYLVAPPAAGKSTLAALMENLSGSTEGIKPIKALGLDGFHYHQSFLNAHTVVRDGVEIPLYKVKGGPESYDIARLNEKLKQFKSSDSVMWPFYDRRIHDVIEDCVRVDCDIALVEGNWLLLRDDAWRETAGLCDYSILITAAEQSLKKRLIDRKVRGGATLDEATNHFEFNDGPNIRKFLRDSENGNLALTMSPDGVLSVT